MWTAPDLGQARRLVRDSGTAGEAVTVWIPEWMHFRAAAGSTWSRYSTASATRRIPDRRRLRLGEGRLGVQAGFNGWYPDFATPAGFIDPALTCAVRPRQNGNAAEFCDPAIDREIARAQRCRRTTGGSAQLWAKIDRDITDQAPWVAFANGVVLEVNSARVGNYQYNPQWGTLLDQLWVR